MIAEHPYAVLIRDIPEAVLVVGDAGVVVQVHTRPGETQPVGYMLELFTVDGRTIETVLVPADAVRPSTDSDHVHGRSVAA